MLRTKKLSSGKYKIIMDKGDYGLPLVMRFTNNNGQILNTDTLLFKIKSNNENIIEQTYTNFQTDENENLFFTFSLTKEESEKLTKNAYTYEVEIYRESEYLNTLINDELFEIR